MLLADVSTAVSHEDLIEGHEKSHVEFQVALAKCLKVDPFTVVFSFRSRGYKADIKILTIRESNSTEFFDSFYGSNERVENCNRSHYDIDSLLPASATTTSGVLESVECKYGDKGDDYCSVLFTYKKRGLARRALQDGTGWYEHPIRGQVLDAPTPEEIFPNKRGGDLFLNWVEYPVRCQVWRFRHVSWVPFKQAGWEPLTWGFQDETTGRMLVIVPGEDVPAFVTKSTFDTLYTLKVVPVIE